MILKAKREKGSFVCISKTPGNDPELSLESKGLLLYIVGNEPKWELSISDILEHCANGRDAVRAALNELIKAGYVKLSRSRDNYGKLGVVSYDVSDTPLFRGSNPQTGNQEMVYGQSKKYHEKRTKRVMNRGPNPQTTNQEMATLNNKRLKDLLLRISYLGEGDNFCHQVFEYIESHMDRPTFGTWIRPLSIKIIDGRLCVIAPDALSSRWIQSNFIGVILDAFSSVSGCQVSRDNITFTIYKGGKSDGKV